MSGQIPRFRQSATAKRVLLVDDDPLILRALRTRLTHAGHDVQSYSDGASALCGLNHWPADVAVLDINMRGLNGFQVASEIRQRLPDCRTVIQTASKSEVVWNQLASQDVDLVLEKPYDSKRLLEMIASIDTPVAVEDAP